MTEDNQTLSQSTWEQKYVVSGNGDTWVFPDSNVSSFAGDDTEADVPSLAEDISNAGENNPGRSWYWTFEMALVTYFLLLLTK